MKRMILIAVLFCLASANLAMAQGSDCTAKPESAAEATIRRAEAEYMKTYNGKGHGLMPTDFKRLDETDAQAKKVSMESGQIESALNTKSKLLGRLNSRRSELEKAMTERDELIEKQSRERADLEEKQKTECAAGMTDEMRQRHEAEALKLEKRHYWELMATQMTVNSAMARCERAEYVYMSFR